MYFARTYCILREHIANDGRSAKNRQRQPAFQPFTYTSNEEKSLFNRVRSLEAKQARVSSHLKYFMDCSSANVYPVNLQYNGSFNVALPDKDVEHQLKEIDQRSATEKMDAAIAHLKLKVLEISEEVIIARTELESLCTDDRFRLLDTKLTSFKSKLDKELIQTKRKKLRKLLPNSAMSEIDIDSWLPHLNLKKQDRKNILSNTDLDDHVVYTAMKLLMEKHQNLIIQPPGIIQKEGFHHCPHETVQVAHNGKHHWILLTSFGGCVQIYDSLQMNVTESLKKQMRQLFSPDDSLPPFKIMNCQQQDGSTDCGLFAIANAVEVAAGNDPEKVIFDQTAMRPHLMSCLESEKLEPFPKYRLQMDDVSEDKPKVLLIWIGSCQEDLLESKSCI